MANQISPVVRGMAETIKDRGLPWEIAMEYAGELHMELGEALENAYGCEDGDTQEDNIQWYVELVDYPANQLDESLKNMGHLIALAATGDVQPIVDAGYPHQLYDHIPKVSLTPDL